MVAIKTFKNMENEETQNEDIETSENNEELESQETEETNEEEETEQSDDSPTLEDFQLAQAKLKELEEKNRQLYARLKKKESDKTEPKETNNNYLTRDEAILLAKGYDEDDISKLQKIAGNGSLIEASKDPMFQAYKKDKERQEKSKKAQLGASGAGVNKGQKPIGEMTEEEHRALFYKSIK